MRLLSLAVLPVTAFAAQTAGPWSEPVTIDSATVRSPSLAFDGDGRSAAAWIRSAGRGGTVRAQLKGRVYDVQASTGRLEGASIATGPRNAIVAWTRGG